MKSFFHVGPLDMLAGEVLRVEIICLGLTVQRIVRAVRRLRDKDNVAISSSAVLQSLCSNTLELLWDIVLIT